MRMTIEDTINTFQHIRNHPKTDEEEVIKFGQELFDTAIDTMRKYQLMQADYENRLKADMVVMLTDLQLEIEELDFFEDEEPVNITQELIDEVKSWEYGVKDCCKVIQQKINSLKEV